jgi:hypothetical protein
MTDALTEHDETKTWWASWTFPTALRESKEISAAWPDGVEGWRTGYSGDDDDEREVWCALVLAPTRDAAVRLIGTMYGSLADQLRWRFGPDEKPSCWRPPADRFPAHVALREETR